MVLVQLSDVTHTRTGIIVSDLHSIQVPSPPASSIFPCETRRVPPSRVDGDARHGTHLLVYTRHVEMHVRLGKGGYLYEEVCSKVTAIASLFLVANLEGQS